MKALKLIIFLAAAIVLFSSCSKDDNDGYELRFVHIMDNESSTVTMSDKGNSIGTYNIYLSAPQFLEPITVTYKITAGNGLTEGVDYELIDAKPQVTFLPGIYDMPVRIKWMAHGVDPLNDNTLVIELVSVSNPMYSVGLPGKDQLQRKLTITKIP